jgi:hypothetical protein
MKVVTPYNPSADYQLSRFTNVKAVSLYALAALYPGERTPRYPLYRKLGGPQSWSGHRDYRKNPLPLPGIELRLPSRPARSQTLYWLSYPAHISILLLPWRWTSRLHIYFYHGYGGKTFLRDVDRHLQKYAASQHALSRSTVNTAMKPQVWKPFIFV